MSETKNESFVANRPKIDTAWIFTVNSDTSATNTDETLHILKSFFDSFGNLMSVNELEYVYSLNTGGKGDDNRLADADVISTANGLTYDDFVNETRDTIGDADAVFRRITISENTAKIRLKDGDYLIKTDSDYYYTWSDGAISHREPLEDVFRISIFYAEQSDKESYYYDILIYTYTDIWFENTEIGETNRNRLAAALSSFSDSIEPDSIEFKSKILSGEGLKSQGYSNLSPEMFVDS